MFKTNSKTSFCQGRVLFQGHRAGREANTRVMRTNADFTYSKSPLDGKFSRAHSLERVLANPFHSPHPSCPRSKPVPYPFCCCFIIRSSFVLITFSNAFPVRLILSGTVGSLGTQDQEEYKYSRNIGSVGT